MEPQEIIEEGLKIVIEREKNRPRSKYDTRQEEKEGFSDLHQLLIDEQEKLDWHINGTFPEKVFNQIAPNQTREEQLYIQANYEPETLDVYVDFSNTIKRGTHNYSIDYPEIGEPLQDYCDDLPKFGTVEAYALQTWPDIQEAQPNGVTVAMPKFQTLQTEEGQVQVADEPMDVIFYNYGVERVVLRKEDEYLLLISDEKSIVEYNGKRSEKGLVLLYFDRNSIFRIVQVGKFVDFEFETSIYLQHDLGLSLWRTNRGAVRLINNQMAWKSHFMPAIAHLNRAVLDQSNLLITKRKSVFPTRVRVEERCDYQGHEGTCEDGMLYNSDGISTQTTCPSCHGTGRKSFNAFTEVIVRPRSDRPGDNDVQTGLNATNALAYVSPPVDTPNLLRKEIDTYMMKAREVLHLKTDPTRVGSVTATERGIDLKSTYAFIKPISQQIFEMLEWCIDKIRIIRFGPGTEEMMPSINVPVDFDLKTSSDWLTEIAEAKKNNLPPIVISTLLYNYLRNLEFTDGQFAEIFELLARVDRLMGVSEVSLQSKIMNGLASREEDVIHVSGIDIIMELVEENPNFLTLPYPEQKAAIFARATQILPPANDIDDLLNGLNN
jgi:hypothetical protein